MEQYLLKKIGVFKTDRSGFSIRMQPEFTPALAGLGGFGHLQVLWWFSGCDDAHSRSSLQEASPYKNAPPVLGTFATRSPSRPNPLALSCVQVARIDTEKGIIRLAYADAEDGSPVLDVKPYTPSLDRVENPQVPAWCLHWPKSLEASAEFDWAAEFNF